MVLIIVSSMKTIFPSTFEIGAALSSARLSKRTTLPVTPPLGVAADPPSAVATSGCGLGEMTDTDSDFRDQNGISKGSMRTSSNPSSVSSDTDQDRARASDSDPAKRCPTSVVRSSTKAKPISSLPACSIKNWTVCSISGESSAGSCAAPVKDKEQDASPAAIMRVNIVNLSQVDWERLVGFATASRVNGRAISGGEGRDLRAGSCQFLVARRR